MLDKSIKSDGLSTKNVSAEEIARFDALAQSWWDPNGQYKTALAFNRARLSVIESQIRQHFSLAEGTAFNGLTIVDIGSGGGLISEPLAQLGASVTGIDASAVSVAVAQRHAIQSGVTVDYQHKLAEELAAEGQQYDVVINAEVVEHVPDQQSLIKQCASMVKPGGLLILATLNRTFASFVIAIVGAEYVLSYLPKGTHDWRMFVKPDELRQWLPPGFREVQRVGMSLNPFSGVWRVTTKTPVNYLMCFSQSSLG